MIELAILPRPAQHARAKQILREDLIPFVMYAQGRQNLLGVVKKAEVATLLRNIRQGFLPTTKIHLKDEQGKVYSVLIKDIQYKPTTYEVIHIDFLELIKDRKVNVKVPVELLNPVDCIGIKMGGFLRQVMRHVPIECLPEYIPSHFEVDLTSLDIGHVRKVKDLGIPSQVRPLVRGEEVVVTIGKH